jgi:excisionase family DNA binding protein
MQEISLTIADAVQRTGISRTGLYRLFRQRKLTPRRSGTRILIMADELDAFVRSLPVAGPTDHDAGTADGECRRLPISGGLE